jgi:hypothetical protein
MKTCRRAQDFEIVDELHGCGNRRFNAPIIRRIETSLSLVYDTVFRAIRGRIIGARIAFEVLGYQCGGDSERYGKSGCLDYATTFPARPKSSRQMCFSRLSWGRMVLVAELGMKPVRVSA